MELETEIRELSSSQSITASRTASLRRIQYIVDLTNQFLIRRELEPMRSILASSLSHVMKQCSKMEIVSRETTTSHATDHNMVRLLWFTARLKSQALF